MGKKANKWKLKFKLTKELLEGMQRELLGMNAQSYQRTHAPSSLPSLQGELDKLKGDLRVERENGERLAADLTDTEEELDKLRDETERERWEMEDEHDAEVTLLSGRVELLEEHLSSLIDCLGQLRVTRVTLDVPQLSPEERVHTVEAEWDELLDLREAAAEALSGRRAGHSDEEDEDEDVLEPEVAEEWS